MAPLSSLRIARFRLIAGILAAGLTILVLSGCGAPSSSGASGPGTGKPSGSATTTTGTTRACGEVHMSGPGGVTQTPGSGGQAPTDCFWQAYTACQPATLVYTSMGVDTYAAHTFTTTPTAPGRCGVTDRVHSMINTKTYDDGPLACSGVRQGGAGAIVVTGCGQFGDVTVPAARSQ